MKINKAIVTTDFSKAAEAALEYAGKTLAEEGTELTLVTVVEGLPNLRSGAMNEVEKFHNKRRQAMIDDVETELQKLNEKFLGGRAKTTVLHSDEPVVTQVCDFAGKQKADMLLTSSKGRGAIANIIHGSVVQKLINLSPCPVLVVSVK